MQTASFNLADTHADWTLFLDRDGVLNHEKNNDYILHPGEFHLYDGVPEAMRLLSGLFKRIIVTTNQKGVGKGLMTLQDLHDIHDYMQQQLTAAGGRIDHIFYCTDLADDSPNRKPNPGMAFQAREQYPDIHLAESLMVGNRPSDMAFGRNAGMHTIYLATTHPETPFPHPDIDLRFSSLLDFAQAVEAIRKA